MQDHLEAYERSRRRMGELAADTSAGSVDVEACPGWTVKDVLAHVVGLCEDVVGGRLEGYATEGWTRAQVERHAQSSVAVLCQRWEDLAPKFAEAALDAGRNAQTFVPLPVITLYDLLSHEQDVRSAVGADRVPDHEAVELALKMAIGSLRFVMADTDLPRLRVAATGLRSWDVGTRGGGERVTVEAEPFELWRSLGGRRSRDQVANLRWSGDPAPYVDVLLLPPFSWPEHDVIE